MDSLRTLYQYLFKWGSPVTLGVFRAIMAGLICINGIMIGLFLPDFLGPKSYIPASVSNRYLDSRIFLSGDFSVPRLNLLVGVENPTILYTFYWAVVIVSFLAAIGLWTRVTTILMAIGVVTLQHRMAILLHGGDSVMRICAVYLAIAPSGAAFSLDRLRAVKAGKAPAIPPQVCLWPQRIIQFNCALVYLTTTWAKWFGVLWKSGAATWYTARLHEFERFPVPGFVNQFPMVKISTWATLLVEFALATLVWFPALRRYVLLSGILLHGFIEYSMNIPLFAFLMVSMYLTFYEGEEVAAWWDRMKAKWGRRTGPEVQP